MSELLNVLWLIINIIVDSFIDCIIDFLKFFELNFIAFFIFTSVVGCLLLFILLRAELKYLKLNRSLIKTKVNIALDSSMLEAIRKEVHETSKTSDPVYSGFDEIDFQ